MKHTIWLLIITHTGVSHQHLMVNTTVSVEDDPVVFSKYEDCKKAGMSRMEIEHPLTNDNLDTMIGAPNSDGLIGYYIEYNCVPMKKAL